MINIDWTKPVRAIYDGSTYRVVCTDAPGCYPVVLLASSGFPTTATIAGRSMIHGCVAFENIPEAVAPVEIQNAYAEGYRAGKCFEPYSHNQIESAWNNSIAKSSNIGKRVV